MKNATLLLLLSLSATVFGFQTEAVIPWVTNNDNFGSQIILSNLNDTPVEVVLVATRNNGEEDGQTLTIPALSQQVEDTATLFGELGTGAGYRVLINALDGNVKVGFVVTGKGSASGNSPAQADALAPGTASRLLVFPYLPREGGFSAPVVVNMGGQTANLRFHAYSDGALAGSTDNISLESGRPYAELVSNLFQDLSGNLIVVAEADQPLLGTAFIFNEIREPSMASANALDRLPNSVDPRQITEERTYEGHVVTGINRFMGEPILNLGHGLETAGFPTVGIFDPEGSETLPLSKDMLNQNTEDYIMAAGNGLVPSGNDNFNANTPLEQVPVVTGVLGLTLARNVLQGILQVDQLAQSIAEPATQHTLAQWLKGSGQAKIRCYDDGTSEILIQVKNLLPNRLYSLWSSYAGDDDLITFAMGGVPNALATDEYGDGYIKRTMNFCPYNLKEGERPLLLVDVVLHSDHMLYGTLPTASLPGKDAHAHLGFFLEGTFLDEN